MNRAERGRRLQSLRRYYKLRRTDIAEITGASYRSVCHWLVHPIKSEYRAPPESAVRLVEMKAAEYRKRRILG